MTTEGRWHSIREAVAADMIDCAAIFNEWVDETSWMPRVHSRQDVESYYQTTAFQEQSVFVARHEQADAPGVDGFISLSDDSFVTALYLARQSRRSGIGKALLDYAKTRQPGGLSLWAFVANQDARRFYEREGFSEQRCTEGDNEEGLPDVLFAWQSEDRMQ